MPDEPLKNGFLRKFM